MNYYFFALILFFNSLSFCLEINTQGYIPYTLNKSHLSDRYNKICKLLQISDSTNHTPVTIIFYKKSETASLGIELPEWGGGGALGNDSIFIPVDASYAFFQSDFNKILTHEIVHIIINRNYGSIRIPRWFHEGIAMAFSGEIDYDAQITISKAIMTGKLMSLTFINNVNRFNSADANLAYCQSHLAVRILIREYGYDLIPELLFEIKKRGSFGLACVNVLGLTPKEIDSLMIKEIKKKYRFNFLFDDSLFWFLTLVLSIIGFFAMLHRKKILTKEMEADEDGKDYASKKEF